MARFKDGLRENLPFIFVKQPQNRKGKREMMLEIERNWGKLRKIQDKFKQESDRTDSETGKEVLYKMYLEHWNKELKRIESFGGFNYTAPNKRYFSTKFRNYGKSISEGNTDVPEEQ